MSGRGRGKRDHLAALVDCQLICPLWITREEGREVARAVAVLVNHRVPPVLRLAHDISQVGNDTEAVAGHDRARLRPATLQRRVHVHYSLP